MRRALVACLIACGTLAMPAAGAPSTPPREALEGFVCQRATNHFDRAIEVVAVMRPLTGTQRMEMKFVLLRQSAGGAPFLPVPGRGLGQWLTPTSGLGQRPSDVWRLNKLVVNLPAASVYRFRVSFRWTGTSGTVLGRSELFSPLCTQ